MSPVGVVFGGQPGSGKSRLIDVTLAALGHAGGAVAIVGDDLRSYHPAYAGLLEEDDRTAAFYTDADAGAWVEKSVAYAIRARVNVVIEGTMRDPAKVALTMQLLRSHGYRVEAHVLVVKHEVSWQEVLERYHSQKVERGYGRMTTPEAHQAAYDGLTTTVDVIEADALADVLALHRRDGSLIFEKMAEAGRQSKPMRAREAIARERKRVPNERELVDLVDGYDRILSLVARSKSSADDDVGSDQEIERVRHGEAGDPADKSRRS